MKKIAVLITGIVLSAALYGCGGEDPTADGGQPVPLRDMEMDMNKEGDILPGGAQGAIQPGGVAGETGTVTGSIHDRVPEEIREYLAQYPDSLQALSEEECYVVLHGQEYSGREYLDSFMGNVLAKVPDELVIAQFTVEGDPILTYLNYNAENVYRMEDFSRDAWAGNGEKYFEKEYDSVWLSGEADTEGNYWLSLYALQEQDMVVEVFSAATDAPLICGLPLEETSASDPALQTAPQIESKLPLIKDLKGSNTDMLLETPPQLMVICGETAFDALRGTYSWQKRNSDGTSTAIEADSAHPLDCKELFFKFETTETTAVLHFMEDPDTILNIQRWSEEHWGEPGADSESVAVNGYEIELEPGGYIYEVIAEWSTEKGGCGGSVHYSFYVKRAEDTDRQ
ncbi:MAG: DUF4362 domain-containing protein [Eubacterium sp.]|nr:DUF4362 domain-containing protein [Eubacterium sp.]MCM1409383.1 DUF4362 domain-containing protein [Lachnospiraceae bacterium]